MVHASSRDGIYTRPIRIRVYCAGLTGVDPMFRTLANNALALTGSVCTLPDLLREVFFCRWRWVTILDYLLIAHVQIFGILL
jgi:hypothetical protein